MSDVVIAVQEFVCKAGKTTLVLKCHNPFDVPEDGKSTWGIYGDALIGWPLDKPFTATSEQAQLIAQEIARAEDERRRKTEEARSEYRSVFNRIETLLDE